MKHARIAEFDRLTQPPRSARALGYRMPAEWAPQACVWLVRPFNAETWPGCLDEAAALSDVKVFHAGTATSNGTVITGGGRVLGVTALGDSIPAAKLQAYRAVKCIRWDGAWCRKDISDKARWVESS